MRNCVSPRPARTLHRMLRLRALVIVQCLMLGLLLAGLAIKPALAASEELHDLVAHASQSYGGNAHDVSPGDDDKRGEQPHDDGHFHLTHCCSHQAAVPVGMYFELRVPHDASPLERERIAFAPAPYTAPFRPPIAA